MPNRQPNIERIVLKQSHGLKLENYMRNIIFVLAALISAGCSKSDTEEKSKFEGKWANIKDISDQIEIARNGPSYLITFTRPNKFFGGPPLSRKAPAVLDKDLLKIDEFIRSTLAIDNQTGLLIGAEGQFRRLTGNDDDKELRGCWILKNSTMYFSDHIDKSTTQVCSVFYDGIYNTSSCLGKNGNSTTISSYQTLRPGVLELAIEENERNPASVGSIKQIEYKIQNSELFITTYPKDNNVTNPKHAIKFESTSKFAGKLSKEECIKKTTEIPEEK